jgi:hypothetical protein
MNHFAEDQVKAMLASGPADREAVEQGIGHCFRAAGRSWHGNVLWVESPLVAAVICGLGAEIDLYRHDHKRIAAGFDRTLRRGGWNSATHLSPVGREAFDLVSNERRRGASSTWRRIIRGELVRGVNPFLAAETRLALASADGGPWSPLHASRHAVSYDDERVRHLMTEYRAKRHRPIHRLVDPATAGRRCPRCRQSPVLPEQLQQRASEDQLEVRSWLATHNLRDDPWSSWHPWIAALAAERAEGLLPAGVGAAIRAYAASLAADNWYLFDDLVVVCERPRELHFEMVGTAARPVSQLHCDDGPAIRSADGRAWWVVHGREVEQWVVEAPAIERIARESNVEVRRIAIEQLGWCRFVSDANLRLVATAPDPGVADAEIALYDLPARWWGTNLRLAVVTNGTPERDGTRRRYGLPVPATTRDPIEAIAWSYDVPEEAYAGIVRRT